MPDYTIDIGYVHVGERIEGEWVCAENCPHPDHFDIEAPRQFGRTSTAPNGRSGCASSGSEVEG